MVRGLASAARRTVSTWAGGREKGRSESSASTRPLVRAHDGGQKGLYAAPTELVSALWPKPTATTTTSAPLARAVTSAPPLSVCVAGASGPKPNCATAPRMPW